MAVFAVQYANFPLLLQEYESDGIDWTKVEFEDNQECLDLFEKVTKACVSHSLSVHLCNFYVMVEYWNLS